MNLTPRQRLVLDCLERGLSLKEAAAALGISKNGIDGHMRLIRRKLRARTNYQALLLVGKDTPTRLA